MSLILKEQKPTFNTEAIAPGYALYGKHTTWDEGKTGIVTAVTASKLVVLFHPGIGNVVNHFFVYADEVDDGAWELKWSKDLSSVEAYVAAEVVDT